MTKIQKKLFIMISILILILLTTSCTADRELKPVTKNELMLDTVISITLYDVKDEAIFDELFGIVRNYEKMLSAHLENSDVDIINKNSGITPVSVHDETIEIIKKSIKYSELSNGQFDITAGPLISLWNIGKPEGKVPEIADIETAKSYIDYKKISIEEDTVMLNEKNMAIDLGAIAKGYIADKIVEKILSSKIRSGIVNFGGNAIVIGKKPDGSPYRVGIQNPDRERGIPFGVYTCSDKSIVSSGIYERYLIENGKRYHHILDVETGFPADNEIKSVSIISNNSFDGDALSTTVLLLGLEKGMNLIENTESCEAVFVTKNNEVYLSEGAEKYFEITDSNFKLAGKK